jgi:hypothetical protein
LLQAPFFTYRTRLKASKNALNHQWWQMGSKGENKMLTSLFGELRSLKNKNQQRMSTPLVDELQDDDSGFAATTIMKRLQAESDALAEQSMTTDNHVRDLVVSGSCAQAIRDHFKQTRSNLSTATRQISLLDPSGLWASSVIQALSEAGGKPVERLHLREQGTLRTLAMIERVVLERRQEEPLRIYHADVRAQGGDNQAVPNALMEHSHLTAVIVGAMSPNAVDEMLCNLYMAVQHPQWRCPTLLFMLPPNAVWVANKIAMIDWPRNIRVQTVNESLSCASAVWNSLLTMWNRAKLLPALAPAPVGRVYRDDMAGLPIRLGPFQAATAPQTQSTSQPQIQHSPLSIQAANESLRAMLGTEGLMGCAVVDTRTGSILARQAAEKNPFELDLAAAQAAQVLNAHNQAAHALGVPKGAEEITTSTNGQYHIIRTSSKHPGLFLFALIQKQKSSLSLARYKLMEAELSMTVG